MKRKNEETSKIKILIVEDENIIAQDVKRMLKHLGYAVSGITDTGKDAIEKVESEHPDLVLMDIVLKGEMDGIETAEKIKTHFEIPIIYLTAYAEDKTLERAKITEPFGYILKPYEERELYLTIKMALYKHALNKRLKDSEYKYRILTEKSTDGIFLAIGNKLVYANSAFLRILGAKSMEDLKDRSLLEFWDKTTKERIQGDIKKALKGKISTSRYEIGIKGFDGRQAFLDLSLTRVTYDDKPHALGIVTDVTERKRTEERIEHLNAILRSIRGVNQLLVREKNVDRLLQGVCDKLIETRGYYNAWIALIDESNNVIKSAEAGLAEDYLPLLERLNRGALADCGIKAISQEDVNIIKTPSLECTKCPLSKKYPERGAMVCRLEHAGKIYGILFVAIPKDLPVDKEEIALFKEVADDIASALHSLELEEEQRKAEKLRASINKISESALSTEDLGELYKAIHNIVGDLMPAENFYIALYGDETQTVSFPYYVDEYDEQPPAAPLGKGLTDYVIRTGKPLLVFPKIYNTLAKKGEIELIGEPSYCWLGVPLRTQNKTMGVLAVQSYTKDTIFGEEDKNILTFVSTQIAMSIERKRADKAIQESREKFLRLFINNPEAAVYLGPDVRILDINPRFTELFGYTIDEIRSKHINDIIVQDDKLKEARMLDKKAIKGYISYDTIRKRKDGSLVPVSISAAPITLEGNLVGFVATYKDITQRKQAEEELQNAKQELEVRVEERTSELRKAVDQLMKEFTERKKIEEEKERMHAQLLQAQKMEAIGTLAGGVAHDFNNLLTAIQGYTDLMLMKVEETSPLHRYLKNIHHASIRAASLTRQLLLFSRKQPMELSLIDVNKTVGGLISMLSRVIGENIYIETALDPDIWNIKADEVNIEQVIMNLALNARDAMPTGGTLTIKTGNVVLSKEQLEDRPESRPGNFVCLSVADTGSGIDQRIIDRIFEPFFSTKEAGRGTGLGLSVAYGIIKQHDGWINVNSEPEKGTTFNVYLPAFPLEVEKKLREKIPAKELMGKGKRILVVEDNAIVREFAVGGLRESGYTVLEASTAKEATEIINREKERFHLVFCDVVLPDKNGIQLVEEIQSRDPDMPVLLCSGYSDQVSKIPKISRSGLRYINKPYALAELLDTVNELARLRK